jgi:hypothetical protein
MEHPMPTGLRWNEQLDAMLKKLKNRALVSMWLQSRASSWYQTMYNALSYPVILISCLSTAAIFSNGTSTELSVKFLSGSASILSALLTAITRQMRPAELAELHSSVARKYETIVRQIEMKLLMPYELRVRPEFFFDKVRTELDSILETKVDPPTMVVWMFSRKYKASMEEILYGSELADIITEQARNSTYLEMIRSKPKSTLIKEFAAARSGAVTPRVTSAGELGKMRSEIFGDVPLPGATSKTAWPSIDTSSNDHHLKTSKSRGVSPEPTHVPHPKPHKNVTLRLPAEKDESSDEHDEI